MWGVGEGKGVDRGKGIEEYRQNKKKKGSYGGGVEGL